MISTSHNNCDSWCVPTTETGRRRQDLQRNRLTPSSYLYASWSGDAPSISPGAGEFLSAPLDSSRLTVATLPFLHAKCSPDKCAAAGLPQTDTEKFDITCVKFCAGYSLGAGSNQHFKHAAVHMNLYLFFSRGGSEAYTLFKYYHRYRTILCCRPPAQ